MADVALAVVLFLLLRSVSPAVALTAMAFRLVQSAIIGANLLNQHTLLVLLNGDAAVADDPGAASFSA